MLIVEYVRYLTLLCTFDCFFFFFFQAEDGIRDYKVTGVQTCALPISWRLRGPARAAGPAHPVDRRRHRRGPEAGGDRPAAHADRVRPDPFRRRQRPRRQRPPGGDQTVPPRPGRPRGLPDAARLRFGGNPLAPGSPP